VWVTLALSVSYRHAGFHQPERPAQQANHHNQGPIAMVKMIATSMSLFPVDWDGDGDCDDREKTNCALNAV